MDLHPAINGVLHPNVFVDVLKKLCEDRGFECETVPSASKPSLDWEQISCAFATKDFTVHFRAQQMPACCAVLVIGYINVAPATEQNYDAALKIIEEATYTSGFGSLLMTQVVRPERGLQGYWWSLGLKRGWQASELFRNAKSGNEVVYLTKNMGHEHKMPGLEFDV